MKQVDPEFVEYVRARQHQLLRSAVLVCGDQHTAEDLLQGAFEKLAVRWQTVKRGNPDGFVRTLLYRDAVSAWRRTRKEHLVAVDSPDQGEPTDAVDYQVSTAVDLRRLLMQLPPRQRAVLVLRYFEDRTAAQTAEILEISVGTVKSQTHDALARLRALAPDLVPALDGEAMS